MMESAAIRERFRSRGFIVTEPFATALQLVLALEKPLLVEGPAGVGKTESAKVLAEVLGARLIRLQCYEGLDALTALYEWNYPRQMLRIRMSEADGTSLEEREAQIFGESFLLKRPLLEAITQERPPVLLIDEVDRADEAFEAFLLEVLAEWQVTIPEIGTIHAQSPPACDSHEQPDARAVGCAAAAVPLLLAPLSHARGGDRDPARAHPRCVSTARGTDRARDAGIARHAAPEGPGCRREPRLGPGAPEPPPRSPRRAGAGGNARLRAEGPGRPWCPAGASRPPRPAPRGRNQRALTRRAQPRHRFRVRLDLPAARVMYPFASLPANLAAFCAELRRDHGFRIGPRELQDAARALQVTAIADEHAVRDVLRPVLSRRLEDVRCFDQAFDRFFHPRADLARGLQRAEARPGEATGGAAPKSRAALAPGETEGRQDDVAGHPGRAIAATSGGVDADAAPPAGILQSAYSPAEAEGLALDLVPVNGSWRAAAAVFVARVETALSRRWKPALLGRRFDLRRTLRASLHTGGEAVLPRWRARAHLRARFVVIIDGSRSMAAHRRPAVDTAVAIAAVVPDVQVFVFSTALREITRDVGRAVAGEHRRLPELHHAWGGGTGIGVCLREVVHRHGWQLLRRDAVVIVASDGLDLGPPEVLRQAMARIHRRVAAIIWLNPLLETAGYEPTATGMRTARPFVSTFAWAGDADGLVRLARVVRVRKR